MDNPPEVTRVAARRSTLPRNSGCHHGFGLQSNKTIRTDEHLLTRTRTRPLSSALAATFAALVVAVVVLLATAAPAPASKTQVAILEVPNIQYVDTGPALQILRSLGVQVLRLPVLWVSIAPDPNSRTRPNFNASDPNAYPAANWAPYDQLVRQATAAGISLDLMPTGGAPLWATASGAPPCGTVGTASVCFTNTYYPSASEYGQFVHALATRYPSVHFWELWNEANWGPSLTPQYSNSSLPISARLYRSLINAGWSALQQTGHGRDTIIASSLSQDGSASVGKTGTTAPLTFIRTVYCLNSAYKHLGGGAARQAGCPTSKKGYRRFGAANPALFKATGWGIHPYPYGKPPTQLDFPNANGVEFAEIPHMVQTVDRVQKVYGSRKRMSIYNTEYGYQNGFVNPNSAAAYLNWAEYLSWKNPRVASYDQYELWDASWFPTGLITASNQLKPTFYAYRLPIWLPSTQTRRGKALEVWGDVRPAHFATADGYGTQYAWIQFSPGGSGSFQNYKQVRITNSHGYFDLKVKFPSSGSVRLAWAYPSGDSRLSDPVDSSQWIYSRVTGISVH